MSLNNGNRNKNKLLAMPLLLLSVPFAIASVYYFIMFADGFKDLFNSSFEETHRNRLRLLLLVCFLIATVTGVAAILLIRIGLRKFKQNIPIKSIFERKIVLLVLCKAPQFGNDYDLFRVLNLIFKIFDPRNLLHELVRQRYITKSQLLTNGTYNYTITEEGIFFLYTDFNNFADRLSVEFPDKENFISVLIKK
jgi:hypothetical protein